MTDASSIQAGKAVINISSNPVELIKGIRTSSGLLNKFFEEQQNKKVLLDVNGKPLKRAVIEAKEGLNLLKNSFENVKNAVVKFGITCENNLQKTFGNLKVHGLALLAMAGPFTSIGDQFNKMAGRTGAGTEFLSEMGHAASLCGANLESLEQAFKKMSQDFVAGQNGNKEVIDSYNKLGLSFEYIATLSPEQRFDALRKAIRGIRDPAEQAGMAQNSVKNKNLKNPLFTASRLRERIFSFF